MRVIGLMSGTSHDSIDVAVAEFVADGDLLTLIPLGAHSHPFPEGLDRAVAETLPPASPGAGAICRLDTELGQAFAEAAAAAIDRPAGGGADLIASHGQTIYHWVSDGRSRGSLQVGNPAWIAERTGLPVVSDFRIRDIASGGNGAPLASTLDVLLLGSETIRAALNLGGIANMTVVGPGIEPLAYDLGPANALLDAAALHFSGGRETCDLEGRRARAGRVDRRLLTRLLADPYYALPPPKATGKELFNLTHLLETLGSVPPVAPDDVFATLVAQVVTVVAEECRRFGVEEVLASGGGVFNPTLMEELGRALAPIRLRTIDELGIPSDAKEAYLMALLGYLTVNGLAGTVPSCTGATHPAILGSLTPGSPPHPFPPITGDAVPPRRLLVSPTGTTDDVA